MSFIDWIKAIFGSNTSNTETISKTEYDALNTKYNTAMNKISSLNKTINDNDLMIKSLTDKGLQSDITISKLNSKIDELTLKINNLQNTTTEDVTELKSKIDELTKTNLVLSDEYSNVVSERDKLKSKIDLTIAALS